MPVIWDAPITHVTLLLPHCNGQWHFIMHFLEIYLVWKWNLIIASFIMTRYYTWCDNNQCTGAAFQTLKSQTTRAFYEYFREKGLWVMETFACVAFAAILWPGIELKEYLCHIIWLLFVTETRLVEWVREVNMVTTDTLTWIRGKRTYIRNWLNLFHVRLCKENTFYEQCHQIP